MSYLHSQIFQPKLCKEVTVNAKMRRPESVATETILIDKDAINSFTHNNRKSQST